MKNINPNGEWLWDNTAQTRIVYCRSDGSYAHLTCVPVTVELQELSEANVYPDDGIHRYPSGTHSMCRYCGQRFNPQIMAGETPPDPIERDHFI